VNDAKRNLILLAVIVLAASVLVVDLLTPRAVAAEVSYVAVVLISLWFSRRRQVFLTAATCTVFAIIGLVGSPRGSPSWMGIVNSCLAIFLIWMTALLGLAARRTTHLEKANTRLQQEVRERERAEERIREQAALIDQVPDAILIRDLEDRILFWSRGAERLYGWTAAEALGRNADDLLYRASRQELQECRREVFERGEWNGEVLQIARDGREIIAETRWVLLRDEQGRPRAKLVVSTDITVRKKLETRLLRAQRLESIGTLASGVAHDFNNLLTPILMAAKLLREDRPEAERRSLLATIQASAERGSDMVKQLLAFAGGFDGQTTLVRPEDVIREVKAILDHTLPRSIQVRTLLARNPWPVQADSTQLCQVLLNLCVNARDAMPEGGMLTLTLEKVILGPDEVRAHPDAAPGPYVLLGVSDTGVGIAPEVLDKIFDPFFTTKGHGKGTGLGLFTGLGIVKAYHGFLECSSEVGKGTRFAVYLPAQIDAKIETTEPEVPEVRHGRAVLILVVEDEPLIRETARTALESHGYQVVTAADGREALVLYGRHREGIKAILLDLMMPVVDGEATLQALRALGCAAPVLATSGLRPTGRVAETLAAEQTTFLPKPYTDEHLLAALGKVLRADQPEPATAVSP